MGRWPTKNGLALPIEEVGFEVVSFERRKTNRHHLYFCRSDYTDNRIGGVFRGLLPHVQTMRIADHADLHERYDPPKQPNQHLMIDVIEEYLSLNGVIDVVREHKTCESYQLTANEWAHIRTRHETSMGGQASTQFA